MTGSAGVTVLLFAAARETAGRGRLEIPYREGLTAAEGWKGREGETPALAPLSGSVSVAVNHRFVPRGTVLAAGDELAFLPPVSGG